MTKEKSQKRKKRGKKKRRLSGLLRPDKAWWLPPGSCRFLLALFSGFLVYVSIENGWEEKYIMPLILNFTYMVKAYFDKDLINMNGMAEHDVEPL